MGFLSGLFGSQKTRVKNLRTPAMKSAEGFLQNLMNRPPPDFPTQQVAPMSANEELAGDLSRQYAGTEPEGLDTLRGFTTEGNILDRPEIQALISEVMQAGQMETNRLGRKIQLQGAGRSSGGYDVLGRSVQDTQQAILASLIPLIESSQNRKMSAATSLASLGEGATLNRINALTTTGALPRQLEQLQQDAEYARQMMTLQWPFETSARIASAILNANMPIAVTGGGQSTFSQAAPLIGALAGLF